jgi:hypothetical protein
MLSSLGGLDQDRDVLSFESSCERERPLNVEFSCLVRNPVDA